MTKDQGLAAVDEIGSLIEGFGSPNEQSRRRLKDLASLLRDSSSKTNFTEKLDSLEHWADIGFSTRKFARFGGADQVRGFARADCAVLKRLISRWPLE